MCAFSFSLLLHHNPDCQEIDSVCGAYILSNMRPKHPKPWFIPLGAVDLDFCQHLWIRFTRGHFFSDWRTMGKLYPVRARMALRTSESLIIITMIKMAVRRALLEASSPSAPRGLCPFHLISDHHPRCRPHDNLGHGKLPVLERRGVFFFSEFSELVIEEWVPHRPAELKIKFLCP